MLKKVIDQDYKPVVGVDIAPDYIRLVELDRVGRDYHLRSVAIEPTPADCMEDGFITRPKVVGKAIRSIMRENGFACKSAVAAVRGSKVVSRLLTLPAMPHDRLRRLIETEINRYVIFGKQEKVVFYHPLEEFDEEHRRRVSIMLVAADKALCNSYYQAINAAGLKCEALDVSTFSILRVLRNKMPQGFKSGSMMSVVYDYQGISFNIFHGDTIRFYRTMKMEGMDPAQLKNGFMDKFVSEMLLAMQFYQSEYFRGEPIRKVVLSLGAAGGTSILERLQDNAAGAPVELHAPFSNIQIDVKQFNQSLLEKIDFNFTTAVGLALRGQESEPLPFRVDLLPNDLADSNEFSGMVLKMMAPLAAILIVFFGLSYYLTAELKKVISDNGSLNSHIMEIDRQLNELGEIGSQWHGIPIELPTGKQFAEATDLLKTLQQVTPENVQLTGFEVDEKDNMTLDAQYEQSHGTVPLDDLMSGLEGSGAFSGVEKTSDNELAADGDVPALHAFGAQGKYERK